MADEKKQLILDLLARNKMGNDTKAAADDLDKLGRAAEGADKKTRSLGKGTETVTAATDKLGHNLESTRGRVAGLDKEIGGLGRELASLSGKFADAGTSAERLDISKSIRRVQSELSKVTKNRNILADLLPDPEPAAKSFIRRLGSGIASSAISLGETISGSVGPTIGISLGAAVAPFLFSALGAALSAGTGVGVLGAGIALALADDDKLMSAATRVGQKFMERLTAGVKRVHLGDEIMASLGVLAGFGDRFIGQFTQTLRKLAPSIVPFIQDVVAGVESISTAIMSVAGNSGPAISALGDSFRLISSGVADFIKIISSSGPEATNALIAISGALADLIRFTAETIATTAKLAEIFGGLPYAMLVGHYKDTVAEAANLTAVQTTLGYQMSNTMRAVLGQTAAISALSREIKAQTDPAFALLNAQDKVTEAQKAAADATATYGAKSQQARTATRSLAEAAIGLQSAAGAASGGLNSNLTPAMRASMVAAGLTEDQMAAVGYELRSAAASARAYEGTYTATIRTVYITESYRVGGADYEREANRSNFRAAGGPIVRGVPYVVGENGPEIVVPDSSGRVLNSAASRGLMVQGASKGMTGSMGYGGGGARGVQVEVIGNDQKLVTLLKYLIRTANVIE